MSPTGLSPCIVSLSRLFGYHCLCNSYLAPATPDPKIRFGLVRFRSPLLTESLLISTPAGTEMFQFPAFAPYALYIQAQVTPSALTVTTGFPIRKSQDQSLFDSSPGHIAAYHVLHRLITPRHPPCTLSSLTVSVACPLRQTTKTSNRSDTQNSVNLRFESSLFTFQRAVRTSIRRLAIAACRLKNPFEVQQPSRDLSHTFYQCLPFPSSIIAD